MSFQFLSGNCQRWSRCNVIRETVPELWPNRAKWTVSDSYEMRRADGHQVGWKSPTVDDNETPCLPLAFFRVHQMAPPRTVVTTSSCSLLLTYRPRKDERLSWPSWQTYSGRFTHTSVTRQLLVERRTAKVRRSKTNVLPLSHEPTSSLTLKCNLLVEKR